MRADLPILGEHPQRSSGGGDSGPGGETATGGALEVPVLGARSGGARTRSERRRRTRLVLLAAAILAVALSWVLARQLQPPAAPPNLVVVRRAMIVDSVIATGSIEPKTKVEIKARVNGIVTALPVDSGDVVAAGQVIAELDREVAEAQVKEAHAGLLAARANGRKVSEGINPADRDYARVELERLRGLRKQGIVSKQTVELAERDFESASTRLATSESDLGIGDALVEQAEARLARAEYELRYATIRSPLDGIVLSREVDLGAGVSGVGSVAGLGTTLMSVADVSELHVEGEVDEVDIGRVEVGMPARVRVDSLRDRVFEGRVTKIAPQGSERDKVVSFDVEVTILGDHTGLRPMMTADAEIVVAEKEAVLVVPEAAVREEKDRSYVERLVRRAGSTERTPVVLGLGNGTEVEVLEGLREGDEILGP